MGRQAEERASQEIFRARSVYCAWFYVSDLILSSEISLWTLVHIICRNKNIENVITIDLHGQHVKQAMRLLKFHLLLPCKRLLIPGCWHFSALISISRENFLLIDQLAGYAWLVFATILRISCTVFWFFLAIQKLKVITGCGSHGVGKSKLKQSVWVNFWLEWTVPFSALI